MSLVFSNLISNFFLLLLSLTQPLWAQYPLPLEYEYHLNVEPSYFSSSENLNNDGQKIALANGGKFTNLTTRSMLYYNLSENLQLAAGANFAYSESNLGPEDRSNLNFSEVFAGTRYFISRKNLTFIPDILAGLTASEADPNSDEVLMSEHAHQLKLGIWMVYDTKNIFPYAYVGTQLMSDDRAWLYLLRAGAKYQFAEYSVYAEVSNSAPFKDDVHISTPQNRWQLTDRVNGGSYKFYSVNPELIEFSLGSDFNVSQQFKSGLKISLPVVGRRVASGVTIMVNLSLDFGSTLEVRDILINKKIEKPKANNKSKTFREQTEDEDQELFEEAK